MKIVKQLLASVLFILSALSSQVVLAADPIWIDVRSAEEYQAGHLKGAVNIVHTDIAKQIATVTKDKNAEIHLYCRSGRRSGLAEDALKQLGFTNVHNAGGYEALKAAADQAGTKD